MCLGMDASSGLLMAVRQIELPAGFTQNEERKKNILDREIELRKDLQHENIVQYFCALCRLSFALLSHVPP
jgi:mitogen-activated protein kinase kinase kinase